VLQAGEPLIPGSFSTCTTDSTNPPRAFAAMNPFRLLTSSHGTCVRYQRTVERLAARIGGINRAGQRLHVTPQTSSAQIRLLEERRGCQLSERDGRNIRLTDAGRIAAGYADQIFAPGLQKEDALRVSRANHAAPSSRWESPIRFRSRSPVGHSNRLSSMVRQSE
jgi:Bacterial regulatory helix-turn-helix protein, lysR family